jgi:peroxiredoxin
MTYIIGPDGTIKYVFPHVSAKTHGDDILKKLEEFGLA